MSSCWCAPPIPAPPRSRTLTAAAAPLHERLAALVDALGAAARRRPAARGMGAVAGATAPRHLARLRELMPRGGLPAARRRRAGRAVRGARRRRSRRAARPRWCPLRASIASDPEPAAPPRSACARPSGKFRPPDRDPGRLYHHPLPSAEQPQSMKTRSKAPARVLALLALIGAVAAIVVVVAVDRPATTALEAQASHAKHQRAASRASQQKPAPKAYTVRRATP